MMSLRKILFALIPLAISHALSAELGDNLQDRHQIAANIQKLNISNDLYGVALFNEGQFTASNKYPYPSPVLSQFNVSVPWYAKAWIGENWPKKFLNALSSLYCRDMSEQHESGLLKDKISDNLVIYVLKHQNMFKVCLTISRFTSKSTRHTSRTF